MSMLRSAGPVSVEESVDELRCQLGSRGLHGFRLLSRCFVVNDLRCTGEVDAAAAERVLAKAGLFLPKQEMTQLCRSLPPAADGVSCRYADLLQAVRGSLSPRRLRCLQLVLDKLQRDSGAPPGHVAVAAVLAAFDASQHPHVCSGSRSEQQLRDELSLALDGTGQQAAAAAAQLLTEAEFLEAWAGISCGWSGSDAVFCAMLERCFSVSEPRSASASASLLGGIRHMLRERTAARGSGPRTESEKLRLMLKWWDLDGSGSVDFAQFSSALQRFGLVLDDGSRAALFQAFDPAGSGRIDYALFVATLYEEDIVSTYWTQRQQREREQAKRQQAAEQEEKRQYVDTEAAVIATSRSAPPAAAVALFVLGGPGSGKGTQCARLVSEFGFSHLSTGDLLRAEQAAAGSPLGSLIGACIAEGRLVPVAVIVQLLAAAIQRGMQAGQRLFLIDGFPRALEQKAAWDEAMAGQRVSVPCALFFDCPLSVLEARLLQRGLSSGRADDNLEAIKKRFLTFEAESRPVLRLFAQQGALRQLDGQQTPDAVYAQVKQIVQSVVQ